MRFSANLGFLWTELPLPQAIAAAASAGFDAVECHWPYETPPEEVSAALKTTGLRMLGLNTRRGNPEAGENGLAALPDRMNDAREAIDEALEYARMIGARNVHVMAGFASGPKADRAFRDNLSYACRAAAPHGLTILIEPLNGYDAPGYYLGSTRQAVQIIEELRLANLKLMFDCYHVQQIEGDVSHRLEALMPHIGHIQFASVPDRGPPDAGELSYPHVFGVLDRLGYIAPLGAEYKPRGATEASLGWLKRYKD